MCNFIGIEGKLWYTLLSMFLQRNYLIYSLDLRTKTWVINYPSDLSVDENEHTDHSGRWCPCPPICGSMVYTSAALEIPLTTLAFVAIGVYAWWEGHAFSVHCYVKHRLAFSGHLFFPTEHLLLLHICVHKCINKHCSVTQNMLTHPPITA